MKHLTLLFFALFLLASCNPTSSDSSKNSETPPIKAISEMSDDELRTYADELAHKYIIADGHVDLPYRLGTRFFRMYKELIGIPIESKEGDFDYKRAKAGGLDAPFMSIYIPAAYQKSGGAKIYADSLIGMIDSISNAHPDKFQIAVTADQVEANFKKGIISLPMGMENGAPLEKLSDVKYYYDKGIRYVTLTHSKDNQISDSSYDTTGTHGGLSDYGKLVVAEMNKVGIMVDISHVSDKAFYQAIEISKAPVIASHSSCRKFTPGWQRNMGDDMIKKLGEKGGVIHINFGSTFLDSKIKKSADSLRTVMKNILADKKLEPEDSLAQPIIEAFKTKHRDDLYSDVEMVANHIDHVRDLAGIDHIGIGSDFDGVGDSLPTGLKDVSAYPNLIFTLLKRGYSEEDIEKICFGNTARVWRQVDKVAAQM